MNLHTLILLLTGTLSYTCLQAQPSSNTMNDKLDDLTSFYHQKAKANKIVGSSLSMVHNGEVIYHSNYGYSDLDNKKPIDDQSIFHWASITKTFTGIAIMQLRDRGLLTLDDPITKYIPELRSVHNTYGDMDEITIRQLLSHTAGFRNPTWPWDGDKEWHPHEPQDWEQLAAMFPYTEIKFEPGTKWSYSNPGIIFLGRIIELITNDDYEYYLDKNILKPLQMNRSYFDKAPYHLVGDLASSYYLQDDGNHEKARFDLNTGITVSNGGLNAPLADMIKYLNFLLGNGNSEDYLHVLKYSSIEKMFEPQIKISPDGDDAPENAGGQFMGLTFFSGKVQNTHLIGHSGNQNGFISHIYLAPKKNIAYAVAYNSYGNTRAADREIMEYIVENIFSGLTQTE